MGEGVRDMTETELVLKIQKLQSELVRLVDMHGSFLEQEVIALSQKIDDYVVEVQKKRLLIS